MGSLFSSGKALVYPGWGLSVIRGLWFEISGLKNVLENVLMKIQIPYVNAEVRYKV